MRTTPLPTRSGTPEIRGSSVRSPSRGSSWVTRRPSSGAFARCWSRRHIREVVAGVADHSRYREDPLGRLSRTSNYVTATSYGAMPEVDAAVGAVRRAHARVRGTSHRGVPYAAGNPALAAWVHNSLTDSPPGRGTGVRSAPALDRGGRSICVGAGTCRPSPRGRSPAGDGCGARPVGGGAPRRGALSRHGRGCPVSSPTAPSRGDAQLSPDGGGCRGHAPRAVARCPGCPGSSGAVPVGRAAIRSLRWTLGYSPRWRVALVRVGAPIPEERFKQKTPFETITRPTKP